MIKWDIFYKIKILVFSPATHVEFYKTCLPQLTRWASANCLLPIFPRYTRDEYISPQGSWVNPLLFFLYNADLEEYLEVVQASIYADDTVTFTFGEEEEHWKEMLLIFLPT
jgi:hypothetical protein